MELNSVMSFVGYDYLKQKEASPGLDVLDELDRWEDEQ